MLSHGGHDHLNIGMGREGSVPRVLIFCSRQHLASVVKQPLNQRQLIKVILSFFFFKNTGPTSTPPPSIFSNFCLTFSLLKH